MRLCAWAVLGSFAVLVLGCESETRTGPGTMTGESCEEPEPLVCATAMPSELPLMATGTTMGATDSFSGRGCTPRGGDGAGIPDTAFQWTAPAAGRYEITTEGSAFDTVLSVRRGCDGEELACNDDVGNMMLQSSVVVDLEACETIVIVVEGYSAENVGAVQVQVSGRESMCSDGIDEDGDGLTDCDDPDCFSVECAGDDWPAAWSAFEWEVLERTNMYRAMGYNCDTEGEFGPAGPLEMDAVIQVAARSHSVDMGQRDFFDHVAPPPNASTFDERMSTAGFTGPSPWGENIAAGQRTAASVVDGWMESDGHCANIMNPAYNVIGIGYAEDSSSSFGTYWTQNFAAGH
ncbi:MAG: CAP domain-containing protein [Sandaracinaceae bacterium]